MYPKNSGLCSKFPGRLTLRPSIAQTAFVRVVTPRVCNLTCNLLQDSGANDAIKILQTKLESLIAVVNKPSPALPPGTLTSMMSFWILYLKNLLDKRERQQRRKSIINIACVHAAAITITSFACLFSIYEKKESLLVI